MRSDAMKKGIEKAPHRSLFKAMGYTQAELDRPLIGVANSANEIIPGHIHLDKKFLQKDLHLVVPCVSLASYHRLHSKMRVVPKPPRDSRATV